MEDQLSASATLAVITILGLAIQRVTEFAGAAFGAIAKVAKAKFEGDFKVATLFMISFVFAMIAASLLKIRLLYFIPGIEPAGGWDIVLTALVLSAGTEAANSLQKYAQYSKDNKKK